MSSLIRSLMVRVGADLTDFKSNMSTAAVAMKNGFGSLDLTQTNDAIYGLTKSIKLTESEFKAATAGMDDWRKNADGLAARTKYLNDIIDDQRTVLDGLQRKLELTKEKYGEDSSKVTDLKTAINNQTAAIKNNEAELTDVTHKLDNFGKESDEAAKKGGLLGKIFSGGFLANIASQAVSRVVSKIKEFAASAVETADNLKKLESETGFTADQLQKMTYVGDDLGVSLETQTSAMKKLINNMSGARKGTGDAYEAFKKLRVEFRDGVTGELRNSKTVFGEVIDALGQMTNETERDAIAQDLLGKSATELNPLIEAGGDAMEDLTRRAELTGAVMSEDAVDALDAAGDAMDHLKQRAVAFVGEGLAKIVGNSKSAAEAITELSDGLHAAADTESLISRYRTLTEEIKDTTLSSEELAQKSAELESVKQRLIDASNGIITAFDLENGTYDQQVTALETANASQKEYLLFKLRGQILANSGAAATEKEKKALEDYAAAQEKANEQLKLINDARTKIASGEVWKVKPAGNYEVGTTWETMIGVYTKAWNKYNKAAMEANEALKENAKSTAETQDAAKRLAEVGYGSLNDICQEFGITIEDTTDALEQNSVEQDNVTASLESASAAVDGLIAKYNEAKDAARSSIDGQVKLFSDLDTSAEVSIANIKKSLQSQIDYLTDYNENLKRAIEKGYDKDLLEQLADGSAASAATLAAMADAATTDVAEINAAFANVEKGKDTFSDTVADMATAFDECITDIKESAKDGVAYIDNHKDMSDAGKNTIQGYIDGINSKLPELRKAVAQMNDTVVTGTRRHLQIQSPSKVMQRLYEHVPEGAAKGILEKLHLPADAMRQMNKAAQEAAAMDLDSPAMYMQLPAFPNLSVPAMRQSDVNPIQPPQQQPVDLSGTLTVVCVNEDGRTIGQSKALVADLQRDARRYPTSRR